MKGFNFYVEIEVKRFSHQNFGGNFFDLKYKQMFTKIKSSDII